MKKSVKPSPEVQERAVHMVVEVRVRAMVMPGEAMATQHCVADRRFPARRPVAVIREPLSNVDGFLPTAQEARMRKISLIVLMSLGAVTAAFAQSASDGVTTSTDPAKVAAVERHAQEVKSRQATPTKAKPAANHAASTKSKSHTQKTAHSKPKASTTQHATSAKSKTHTQKTAHSKPKASTTQHATSAKS